MLGREEPLFQEGWGTRREKRVCSWCVRVRTSMLHWLSEVHADSLGQEEQHTAQTQGWSLPALVVSPDW